MLLSLPIKKSKKRCKQCKQWKALSEFHNTSRCKSCNFQELKSWIKQHPVHVKQIHKKYYQKHRQEILEYHKQDYKKNLEKYRLRYSNYRRRYPWRSHFRAIKQRCTNPKASNYENYGGRGIKCLITEEEIKQLWFRDNADLLTKPHIHRKNNNGDYTFENCEFLEGKEHMRLHKN